MKKRKAIVLVTCFYVIIVLLTLSAVIASRVINENKLSQRNADSMAAFYAAEAGIQYAYAEASRTNFNWYTHTNADKDNKIISAMTLPDGVGNTLNIIVPATDLPNADIDGEGFYVAGQNFRVKAYPEQVNNEFTGVIVIRSIGEVEGNRRVIEYRLGRNSAYEYFFYYPFDRTFSSDVYDGRNFGKIHVNGDIGFIGTPRFYFLTELSSSGSISRQRYGRFPNPSIYWDDPGETGEMGQSTSISRPGYVHWQMYLNLNYRMRTGNTVFKVGEVGAVSTQETKYLRDYLEGDGAAYEFDKYYNNPKSDSTDPAYYSINYEQLSNLAKREFLDGARWSGNNLTSIFSETAGYGIEVQDDGGNKLFDGEQKEGDAFTEAFAAEGQGVGIDWDDFWGQWVENHTNDFSVYYGETITGGNDWERRFFTAAFNWNVDNTGMIRNINREWWEDLSYGDDRASLPGGTMVPANTVNSTTGLPYTDRYWLNSAMQGLAWEDELAALGLDGSDRNPETNTVIKHQYGTIDTGDVISTRNTVNNTNIVKAKEGGIYIGLDEAGTTFLNPINDAVQEKSFFNVTHPAIGSDGNYAASNVLEIDVQKLKDLVCNDGQTPQADGCVPFNGMVYVNLEGYSWSSQSDPDATSVMLVNGEKLPDAGLSIVTPHNVMIKGNYNLDPVGDEEKNRPADDPDVLAWAAAKKDYIPGNYEDYLEWQPAEVITNRAVYTLSTDFPEPAYMPMNSSIRYQWYDEDCPWCPRRLDQNFVDTGGSNYTYPRKSLSANEWVPTVAETLTGRYGALIQEWVVNSNGVLPTEWNRDEVENLWGANEMFPVYDRDGEITSYILGQNLRNAVANDIEFAFDSTFGYIAVHGNDGTENLDTPSQINRVGDKHVYNTAIVTPYSTAPSVLEYWRGTDRVITGSFIQLSNDPDDNYSKPKPSNASYGRTYGPDNFFNYEARYGKSADPQDIPAADLTFGSDSSWREVYSYDF